MKGYDLETNCVNCDNDLDDIWVKVMTHSLAVDNMRNTIKIRHCSDKLYPDTDFGYVCTVTLTLELWSCVKVMTHPWVMNNKCVKYYPDPTWQRGVMAQTRILGMCAL